MTHHCVKQAHVQVTMSHAAARQNEVLLALLMAYQIRSGSFNFGVPECHGDTDISAGLASVLHK